MFKDSFRKTFLEKIHSLRFVASETPSDPNDYKIPKNDLEGILENFVDSALCELGMKSILSAQGLFFQKTGKAFTDDVFYDTRISYFFDCFLYCPIEQYNPELQSKIHPSTNIFEFISNLQYENSTNEKKALAPDYRKMIRPTHSVFKILKIDDKSLHIKDLLNKRTFQVQAKENQSFVAINKSSYLQGFIFRCSEGIITSTGFFVHPNTCSSIINQAIQKTRTNQLTKANLLEKLAFAQIKHFRLRHVPAKTVYRELFLEKISK